MVYLDTSVLVALFCNEAKGAAILRWYEAEQRTLVAGDWCMVEVAGALAIKERTGQLKQAQCDAAWALFGEFCRTSMLLLPLDRELYAAAAQLVRVDHHGLRAGDALHLALALQQGVEAFYTLDARLEQSARACALECLPSGD